VVEQNAFGLHSAIPALERKEKTEQLVIEHTKQNKEKKLRNLSQKEVPNTFATKCNIRFGRRLHNFPSGIGQNKSRRLQSHP